MVTFIQSTETCDVSISHLHIQIDSQEDFLSLELDLVNAQFAKRRHSNALTPSSNWSSSAVLLNLMTYVSFFHWMKTLQIGQVIGVFALPTLGHYLFG